MKRADMIGEKYGLLTVKSISPNRSGKRKRLMYLCDCDCGNKNIEIIGEHLRSGHTKSCGCIHSNDKRKYNKYDLSGEYGIGWTSNTNKEFYFDLEDYDKIKDICWYSDKNDYVVGMIKNSKENKYISLHRLIMNANKNEIVDHIKHNKLDNRKTELRIGTQKQNTRNVTPRKNTKTKVTGVSIDSRNDKYVSEIHVDKKKISLGRFDNLQDAIIARRNAEDRYFKEWSYNNSMAVNGASAIVKEGEN